MYILYVHIYCTRIESVYIFYDQIYCTSIDGVYMFHVHIICPYILYTNWLCVHIVCTRIAVFIYAASSLHRQKSIFFSLTIRFVKKTCLTGGLLTIPTLKPAILASSDARSPLRRAVPHPGCEIVWEGKKTHLSGREDELLAAIRDESRQFVQKGN